MEVSDPRLQQWTPLLLATALGSPSQVLAGPVLGQACVGRELAGGPVGCHTLSPSIAPAKLGPQARHYGPTPPGWSGRAASDHCPACA